MIAGRRTYFDQFFNALVAWSGGPSDFEFPYFFYDYQIKVNVDLNQDHRLTYSRFYVDEILYINFPPDRYESYDIISDYYEESK